MVKKGGWTKEEDQKLAKFINDHGLERFSWETISKKAGLDRCGKSCRLRWKNYLSPHLKRGSFSEEEEVIIVHLHSCLGNKWSQIAAKLPGRTDNDIKNFWNTKLRKKLLQERTTEYPSQPRQSPTAADNLAANCIIMTTLSILLGFLNLPPQDLGAQMLLLQELDIRKQQEVVMASILTTPYIPHNALLQLDAQENESNARNSRILSELYKTLGSDSLFRDGYNQQEANVFKSYAEYCIPPALVLGTGPDEIPATVNGSDQFCGNPYLLTSPEYEPMENAMSCQSPELGSTMHAREILSPCAGLSPSFVDNASSSGDI